MKLKELVVSPQNVRIKSNEEGIFELSESIKENSLISKIVLREVDGKYEIIAGQRRYKALLSLLGEDAELPTEDYVVFKDLSDKKAFILSISENTHRLDLSPMELNKAGLKLNGWGYKDKEIAKILAVPVSRLKSIFNLSQDNKRIPEAAKQELLKSPEDCKFTDKHWDKLRDVENEAVVKDVVDYILEKDTPPREVPSVIKAMQKQYEQIEASNNPIEPTKSTTAPPDEDPMEYSHKGELKLEIHDGKKILKVIGKGEDEQINIDQYLEYLSHPEQFRCFVTFKLKIKPV